jgi:formiminotetrahydrofolate cyclodeaminase
MRIADACWDAMLIVASKGNVKSASDLQVGVRCLEVGIWGCWKNVEINLFEVSDEEYKLKVTKEAGALAEKARVKCEEVLTKLALRDSSNKHERGSERTIQNRSV